MNQSKTAMTGTRRDQGISHQLLRR